jgi:hypothetical protein
MECERLQRETPSLWTHWNDTKKCYSSGRFETRNDYTITLIDRHDPYKGVKLRYRRGETFDHGLPYGVREGNTEFTIQCNPNFERTKPISIENPTLERNILVYKFLIESKYACPSLTNRPSLPMTFLFLIIILVSPCLLIFACVLCVVFCVTSIYVFAFCCVVTAQDQIYEVENKLYINNNMYNKNNNEINSFNNNEIQN